MNTNYLEQYESLKANSNQKNYNRSSAYTLFFKYIANQLTNVSYNGSDKYTIFNQYLLALDEQKNKSLLEIENLERDGKEFIRNKFLELEIDVINRVIELYLEKIDLLNEYSLPTDIFKDQNSFSNYPTLDDPDFNTKILKKKEFSDNRMHKIKKKSISETFSKSQNQKFIKNYISPYTPYNSVLLWYEVGVGKTCAAISIAETYKEYINSLEKKIIILTPSDTLTTNWRDEIFNLEKEVKKRKSNRSNNVQCTGTNYNQIIEQIDLDNLEKTKRNVNKVINTYYEFMGYQKLAGIIKRELKQYLVGKKYHEQSKIRYIKEKFSNTVIIMDEVHFTREGEIGKTSEKDKVVRPWLEMIARYAVNTKLILLTATPMYNVSREIIWLLNLMLWNDKRSPIEDWEIFDKKGIKINSGYTMDGTNIKDNLINKSRGYISFVRGQNPYTFPIKLDPISDKQKVPSSLYKVEGGQLIQKSEDEKIKKFYCYESSMSSWQFNEFSKINNFQRLELNDTNEKVQTGSFGSLPLQCSNIIYPILGKDGKWSGATGSVGFNSCFTETITAVNDVKYNTYTMVEHCKNYKNNNSILHIDNINDISCKIKSILESVLTSDGVIFIYSSYLNHGIIPMALALEENGFKKLSFRKTTGLNTYNSLNNAENINFCTKNKKFKHQLSKKEAADFNQARYIQLDGSISKNELNQLVKESKGQGINSTSNLDGHHVKVILGSSVIAQGISFFGIRETHVMDPWFHFNQLNQVSGRAIRSFSHISLPLLKRNVSLFLHISGKPKDHKGDDYELIDERVYRIAYNKAINMAKIERLLKINSIDCGLNIYNNLLISKYYDNQDLENIEVIDSKGIKRNINLYDKDYSSECEYDLCDYNCLSNKTELSKTDNSTFNGFFSLDDVLFVKEIIKNLFIDQYVYNDTEIKEIVESIYPEVDQLIIYRSLDQLVKNKEIVYDMYKKEGYIIERNNYYIFHPKKLTDENAAIKYRYLENYIKNTDFNLDLVNIQHNQLVKKTSKKIIPKKKEINFNKYFHNCNDYIIKKYPEYGKAKGKLPNWKQLISYYFLSYFEKMVPENERLEKLKLTLINIRANGKFTDQVERILYENYYTPKKFSYYIDENMIYNNGSDKLIGLIFISETVHNNYRLFIFKNEELTEIKGRERAQTQYQMLKPNQDHLINNSGIFGYNSLNNKKNSTKFYVVNKEKGFVSKSGKTARRGGVCGTAKGATEKNEIIKLVESILLDIEPNYQGYKGILEIQNKTDNNLFKTRNLCEELELYLRHRDNEKIFSDINVSNRFFYRLEEKVYIKIYE